MSDDVEPTNGSACFLKKKWKFTPQVNLTCG